MDVYELNGLAIHAARRPAKDGAATLAFSNSLGTDFRIWDPLVAVLPEDLGILRYDKRGHGLSSLGTPHTLADNVADFAALIEAHGGGPVVAVGLSVGGLIAQGLAMERPDLVQALVLTCTGAKIGTDALWDERIAAVEKDGTAALLEGTMERWFTARFREQDGPVYHAVRAMFERQSAAGYIAMCQVIKAADLRERAGEIKAPTLGIAGAHDGATPPSLMNETVARIDGARAVVMQDAAHIPCVEAPDALAGHLLDFLAEKGLTHGR